MRWEYIKDKLLRIFGSLFMEKDHNKEWVTSIGRVSWWVLFIPAINIWVSGGDISVNHFNLLIALAVYNFGKKVKDSVSGYKKAAKGDSVISSSTPANEIDI